MSADLHIHIFEGITEQDLKYFFCNSLGSKYFDITIYHLKQDNLYKKISNTPNIWIGSVSWLKAGLSKDNETYIPTTVNNIQKIINEDLPELTDKLINDILNSFELENKTSYDIAKKEDVKLFLNKHKGKKIFTVSW